MTTAAEALRIEGGQQAEDHADPRMILMIDAAIDRANDSGEFWSANDIRDQFPSVRNGLVGRRIDVARRRKKMTAHGFVRSTLPSTRSAWIVRWRGAAR